MVLSMNSGSLFRFPHHCGIGDFGRLSALHRLIFMTLGEVTDADNVMNPQHFGSDPADGRHLDHPNLEVWIGILDHFWLLDALAEVCGL